jgi:hypothetical protein
MFVKWHCYRNATIKFAKHVLAMNVFMHKFGFAYVCTGSTRFELNLHAKSAPSRRPPPVGFTRSGPHPKQRSKAAAASSSSAAASVDAAEPEQHIPRVVLPPKWPAAAAEFVIGSSFFVYCST